MVTASEAAARAKANREEIDKKEFAKAIESINFAIGLKITQGQFQLSHVVPLTILDDLINYYYNLGFKASGSHTSNYTYLDLKW